MLIVLILEFETSLIYLTLSVALLTLPYLCFCRTSPPVLPSLPLPLPLPTAGDGPRAPSSPVEAAATVQTPQGHGPPRPRGRCSEWATTDVRSQSENHARF